MISTSVRIRHIIEVKTTGRDWRAIHSINDFMPLPKLVDTDYEFRNHDLQIMFRDHINPPYVGHDIPTHNLTTVMRFIGILRQKVPEFEIKLDCSDEDRELIFKMIDSGLPADICSAMISHRNRELNSMVQLTDYHMVQKVIQLAKDNDEPYFTSVNKKRKWVMLRDHFSVEVMMRMPDYRAISLRDFTEQVGRCECILTEHSDQIHA